MTALAQVAEAAEALAATSSRLEKAALLAPLLTAVPDADLVRLARLLAGQVFPLYDQRTVNVGTALLLGAIAEVARVDRDTLRPRLVQLGDVGEVAAEALAAHTPEGSRLTLEGLEAELHALATRTGTKRRAEAVAALLRRATPAEARLVTGLLSGDLRIGLREGGVEDALARAFDQPLAAVQRATMLTGDVGEAALLARHGRLEGAALHLFHPFRFMLATAADQPEDVARTFPEGFAVEDKYDGIRAQLHVGPVPEGAAPPLGVTRGGVHVALFSRQLSDLSAAFPELVDLLAEADARQGAVLDGEILPVHPETGAILPFQSLQPRLGRLRQLDTLRASHPVTFIAYDVLVDEGTVVMEEPLTDRRARLEALGPRLGVTVAPQQTATAEALDTLFEAARARGNEGLMCKRLASPYRPGKRGRDWLKVKRALATLDVVVTAVEVGHGRRRHLLSDFTFAVRRSPDDPALLNVGKAYSGLTDAELADLTAHFEAHTLQTFAHGKVRTVEPNVVIEVAFDRVQPSARHKSGFALRFPRIVRLRPDKPVAEIDTLDAVAALASA